MNPNPLYFSISIPFSRWSQFLRTKKPEHDHDSGNGSIDYGEFITYEGIAESARAKEIMLAIGFRFSHYKDNVPYNFHFAKKSAELNWDFDFPVDEPVIIPIYKVRGVKNIIERTRHLSLTQMEDNLDGWRFYIAKTVWSWSAIRISSDTQEKYFEKHGWDKTLARVNKFRQKLGLEALKTV